MIPYVVFYHVNFRFVVVECVCVCVCVCKCVFVYLSVYLRGKREKVCVFVLYRVVYYV